MPDVGPDVFKCRCVCPGQNSDRRNGGGLDRDVEMKSEQ